MSTDLSDARAAALERMRSDTETYIAALFKWLEGNGETAAYITKQAMSASFYHLLVDLLATAEARGFDACPSDDPDCRCPGCTYPAQMEFPEIRSCYQVFLDNVTLGDMVAAGMPAGERDT